jgi:hypothetical protein
LIIKTRSVEGQAETTQQVRGDDGYLQVQTHAMHKTGHLSDLVTMRPQPR